MKSLQSRIQTAVVSVTLAVVATIVILVNGTVERMVVDKENAHAHEALDLALMTIRSESRSFTFHQQALLDERRQALKSIVENGLGAINHAYNLFLNGEMTEKNAQHLAQETVRQMRYAGGSGYIWIQDCALPTPTMLMHPSIPQIEGGPGIDRHFYEALGDKTNLLTEFVHRTEEGPAYVPYKWPKPTSEGLTSMQPKLSYVTRFAPWGWLVGTGLYIDDIEKTCDEHRQNMIANTMRLLKEVRLMDSGYLFIFDSDGIILLHPRQPIGESVMHLINPETGMPVFQEIMDAAHTPTGRLDYPWNKPGRPEDKLFRKIAYVRYFEPFDWYIAASIYEDELHAPARTLSGKILWVSTGLLLTAIILSWWLVRGIVQPLTRLADSAQHIQAKGVENVNSEELLVQGPEEVETLGLRLHQLLHSLRQEQQQLRTFSYLVSSAASPITMADLDGRLTYANPAFLKTWGYDNETEVLGRYISDLWLIEHDMDEIQKLMRKGGSLSRTTEARRCDGDIFPVQVLAAMVNDKDGRPIAMMSSLVDLTALTRSAEALRKSDESLRATLDSIGEAVIATDANGRVTRMNPVGEALTGWPLGEAMGRPLPEVLNIIHGKTREPIENPVNRVMTRDVVVELEDPIVLISRNGKEFRINNSGAPIRNDQGKVIGVVLVFRDMTEKYAVQEQLRQSQKMEAIGQLAGGVAHDFNNMLGGIMGAAELLGSSIDSQDSDIKQYLSLIMESTQHAADLATQLLAFSRKKSVTSTSVSMHQIVHDTIDILKKTIDKRIIIDTDLTAESCNVMGDASRLQSAFLNLGINAAHAMPEGGRLTFESKMVDVDTIYCDASAADLSPGPHIDIAVCDTGHGIRPEHLEKIFDPFFTTKAQGQGTGLGLAACYGTIQQHKGAISVYSEVGCGTTFHVTLPLTDVKADHKTASVQVQKGGGTILLVDDESVMRITGEAILSKYGYTVLIAENGEEAMERYRAQHDKIDLVICDMVMPKMNGRDCFFALKKINPQVLFILASGFIQQQDTVEMESQGLAGYIKKPFHTVDFIQIVQRVMASG